METPRNPDFEKKAQIAYVLKIQTMTINIPWRRTRLQNTTLQNTPTKRRPRPLKATAMTANNSLRPSSSKGTVGALHRNCMGNAWEMPKFPGNCVAVAFSISVPQ